MANRIFIAGTRRNAGKTSISLGLAESLINEGYRVGYMKPIAQRYAVVDGEKVSEDVLLMKEFFGLKESPTDMSPFIVEEGFTDKYIKGEVKSPKNKILRAYKRIEKGSDVVIIEGTGHAGVGSIFNLSNADIARLLDAQVLIVSEGGVGSTVDSLTLTNSLFKSQGCSVLGVIVNKVIENKLEKIKPLLKKGIKKQNNLQIFGFLPYKSILLEPTLLVVKKALNLSLINKGDEIISSPGWSKEIEKVIIATMEPHVLMEEVTGTNDNVLIVTSSDRSDAILAALTLYHSGVPNLLGVLLTGSKPPDSIVKVIEETNLPIMIVDGNVYSIAYLIHDLTVKITQKDEMKINILTGLFDNYIDKEPLLEGIFTQLEEKPDWLVKITEWWSKIKEFFSKIKEYFQKEPKT
ncbi:MAG: AAA family ATPase [candidate division WOR-3 bacterium]|nr:AAA family ATPase [candidate division WOR-3 bacterium]